MRYWHIIIAAVFALFALVQLNDQDSLLWVLMYGYVAVVAALAARGRHPRLLIGLGLLVALGWFATLLPAFIDWLRMGAPTIVGSMKAETPYVELTREFLGLLLCLGALGGYLWLAYRVRVRA